MQKPPYIGITDFTSPKEAQRMLISFEKKKGVWSPSNIHQLHVGVMMSQKTLHGEPSKWADVFPKKEDLADIFSVEGVMTCLHYADYEHRSGPIVWESLVEAIGYGGTGLNSLQLDMPWPEPADIYRALHVSRRKLDVILQVGKNAFEEIHNDKDELCARLEDYVNQEVIHYVLLDLSMGQGKEMDPGFLLPYLQAIRENFPDLGLVVAGGLGPDTVQLIEPIVQEFPDISIDAQGKLRPSGSAMDPIDWTMATTYLQKALEILNP